MKPFLRRLLIVVGFIAVTVAVCRLYYVPRVVRTFQWHRTAFERTAARVQALPDLKDGDDAPLDEDIYAAGITYVRKRGDCVIFSYGNFVTDSIWQIVYTPRSFRGLPVASETGGPFNRILRIQKIDHEWYYWELY